MNTQKSSPGRLRSDSPAVTSSQRLLEANAGPTSFAQFARYPDDQENYQSSATSRDLLTAKLKDSWTPLPLKTWFWVPFVVVLGAGAIALEVALYFNKRNQGWPLSGNITNETKVLHYAYTLPPVAIAAVLVGIWAQTDIEIKKMQPYVDLIHGDSPAHRSLFLDYTRISNFVVWTKATSNKHYIVALTSILVVLSLTFQPLAAALVVLRDTTLQIPDVTVNTLTAIGLNQNLQFNDLSSFLTAAGYSDASILYNLPEPPSVHEGYTVASFQLPTGVGANGMVSVNTTAIKSEPGCQTVVVNKTALADGTGWNNSASLNGCSATWNVNKNSTVLFGTQPLACNLLQPPQFSPIVFWFFTYQPAVISSAVFCSPTITLLDVNVNVDLVSGNITMVTELQLFSSSSNFSSFSGNVTGPPLNGRAYNGIAFNLTNPDQFVLQRQNATRLQLPAAVYQAALQSPAGLIGSFQADSFTVLCDRVYRIYLTMTARSVYFLPVSEPIALQVKTIQKRLWLSNVAVHILSIGMLFLAFFGTVVHLLHRFDRRDLNLRHESGTIVTAVSIGAQTGTADLLAERQGTDDISEVFGNKKFRIDPYTMRIVMEGEEGYEDATSPVHGRRSIFAAMQGQRRSSRRFSDTPTALEMT